MGRLAAALLVLAFATPISSASAARVGATEAARIAAHDPKVIGEREEGTALTRSTTMVDGNWQVAWFANDDEVALVIVDPESGEVRESWTGYQVAWKMARGYPGAFGHKLNAPYVFLPLCAIFLLGLVDWRRPGRAANLDLLVLLGFGVSNFFFNRAEIGVSVPLQYVPLAYLFGRALWIGLRGRAAPVSPIWPATWLLVAALFLIGFRIGLDMADSGVIDVGYASEVGASRIAHGEPVYANFPDDVSQGDTYGPVNYYAYVPFERIWPWSGTWNDLPAAHAAAVFFDLAAFALLILLGRRIRPGPAGSKLAATLAFGWAAYPYTAYTLLSNSNDTLVALLLVGTLVVLARPAARGAMVALATFAKFAPVVLVPMLATYRSQPAGQPGWLTSMRTRVGASACFLLAFAATSVLVMFWPALNPGLHAFWDRTIAYQAGRDSPFSIWGQLPALEPMRVALMAAVACLALLFAVRPKEKKLFQVAALSAALLIGVQLTMRHWFYLYIVWFYPLLLVSICAPEAEKRHSQTAPRPRGYGAGTITGSIESASPRSFTSTTAPITQTSSSAVSNLTGIWVISCSSTSSGFTPRTLVRDPVIPTSEMKAVPCGSTRASAVGTWVWVPSTAATRPSRCHPMATFSLVTSAWKSTRIKSHSILSRMLSTSMKGERATLRPTAPLRLITPARRPPTSTTV